jgi:hypothetical protein
MPSVSHRGICIAIEHPALWVDKGEQIVRDLIDVFVHPGVSSACLRHLISNQHRLTNGHYELSDGRGCLMFLLTEPLGPRQIRSKNDLTRFFGRERGFLGWLGHVAAKDSPEYQPAKWLVRLVDAQYCEQVRARYGRSCELFDYDLVIAVAEQILARRQANDSPVESRAGFLACR